MGGYKSKELTICVDFDGTLAEHEWPGPGEPVLYAIDVCKELQAKGHKLILYTMRSEEHLQAAVDWCKERGLEFWDHNHNPDQAKWSKSPKVYGHIFIDDAALGTPLIFSDDGTRPRVDWLEIRKLLVEREVL